MKKETVSALINAHVKEHLSPKLAEREMVSREYETLCGFVGGSCFQSGSYARFTSTTPVNDLDLIWLVPDKLLDINVVRKSGTEVNPNHLDPSAILSELANNLESAYKQAGRQVRIETQSHSIGIYFGESDEEFSIDLVPAIATGRKNEYGDDIYWVPQIAELSKSRRRQAYSTYAPIDWIKSDPRGYIQDAQEMNDQNASFRKVAKFVKKWRLGCKSRNDDFPLKSFHLELIVSDIFKEDLGLSTFSAIEQFFSRLDVCLVTPAFVDRADPSRFVDAYVANLTSEEREEMNRLAQSALAILQEMLGVTSTEDGVRQLIDQLLTAKERSTSTNIVPDASLQISLGSITHVQSLRQANIIDYGEYPCRVKIHASIWFKGPHDRKVNMRLQREIRSNTLVPIMHQIKYEIVETDAPHPYRVYWQVVNTGRHAEQEGGLRGEVFEGESERFEHSLYTGKHWIECFIVTSEGVCIARSGRFYVSFINPSFPLALPAPMRSYSL